MDPTCLQGLPRVRRPLRRLPRHRPRRARIRRSSSPTCTATDPRATSRSTATSCSSRWTPRRAPRPVRAAQPTASTPGAFEGIRVFDISDPADPRFVKAARTDCGSHTNRLVPGEGDMADVYVASYPLSASNIGPDCQAPSRDLRDPGGRAAAGAGAGDRGWPSPPSGSIFGAAYGITPLRRRRRHHGAVPKKPAAACLSQGQPRDISNPLEPVVTAVSTSRRRHLALGRLHSGREVRHLRRRVLRRRRRSPSVRCGPTRSPTRRRRPATTGSLDPSRTVPQLQLPAVGPSLRPRFLRLRLGTSVVDLTDPAAPKEIAFYDIAQPWSTYFNNGLIVANDISRVPRRSARGRRR